MLRLELQSASLHTASPAAIQSSSGDHILIYFYAPPAPDGWARDPEGSLLYWVPLDYHIGLHSPAVLTIPPTSQIQSLSLNFGHFTLGTSWTHVFNTV